MKQKATIFAFLAVILIHAVSPAPTRAIAGTAIVALAWDTHGNANPFLGYEFQSYHEVSYSQYNALEGLAPVLLVGQMKQGNALIENCLDGGLVNGSINVSCSSDEVRLICPVAEGVWTANTRATALASPLGFILAAQTGPTYANCPPIQTPCQLGIPTDVDRVISLDTGLPVDASALTDLPSVRLQRRAEDAHGEFMLDEWAIVEPAANRRVRVHKASSDAYAGHLDGEPRPLLDAVRRATGGRGDVQVKRVPSRYLVVQGSGHRHKLPLPMVRLEGLQPPPRVEHDETPRLVVLRAFFDHHGQLQQVEALDGDADLARPLAEALRLDFVEGAEHRAAVYAVFELGGGATPKLLSAQPVLPRCCCGLTFCV